MRPPSPLFPCPTGKSWGNATKLSMLDLKPLKVMAENGVEKKGA